MTNASCSLEPSWLLVNIPRKEQRSGVPNVDNYHHRWFFYLLKLRIPPNISAIQEINLTESAYIETSAKVGIIKGKHTLLIVDSRHIGLVHAKHVILCNSRAESVFADTVSLFASKVREKVIASSVSTWEPSRVTPAQNSAQDGLPPQKSPKMILHVIKRNKVFAEC
jgi:hypothetical protein